MSSSSFALIQDSTPKKTRSKEFTALIIIWGAIATVYVTGNDRGRGLETRRTSNALHGVIINDKIPWTDAKCVASLIYETKSVRTYAQVV